MKYFALTVLIIFASQSALAQAVGAAAAYGGIATGHAVGSSGLTGPGGSISNGSPVGTSTANGPVTTPVPNGVTSTDRPTTDDSIQDNTTTATPLTVTR